MRDGLISCLVVCLLTFANEAISADVSNSPKPAFAVPESSYIVDESSIVRAPNMPPVHNQGGLELCSSEAAMALYLQNLCTRKKMPICGSLTSEQTPSVLSWAAITNVGAAVELNKGVQLSKNNPVPVGVPHSSGIVPTLFSLQQASLSYSDACFPWDTFINRFPGNAVDQAKASRRVILKLQNSFNEVKHGLPNRPSTRQILTELSDDFGATRSEDNLEESFKETDFGQFLGHILFANCHTMIPFSLYIVDQWPEETTSIPTPFETSLEKIIERLRNQIPIGLEICLREIPHGDFNNDCTYRHSIVVDGYSQACKAHQDCIDLLHVHNSWGAQWQEQYNDGWMQAKPLLEHVDIGRSTQMIFYRTAEGS